MYFSKFSGPAQNLRGTGSKWTFYNRPRGRNAEAVWRLVTLHAIKSFPEAIPLALRQPRRIEWNLIWKATAVPLEAQRTSLRAEKELISLTLDIASSYWRAKPSLWTCILGIIDSMNWKGSGWGMWSTPPTKFPGFRQEIKISSGIHTE